MPIYTFINNETGEEHKELVSISALDDFLKENPHLTLGVSSPAIISGRGFGKPDDTFRDLLKDMKKNNSKGLSKSTINTF